MHLIADDFPTNCCRIKVINALKSRWIAQIAQYHHAEQRTVQNSISAIVVDACGGEAAAREVLNLKSSLSRVDKTKWVIARREEK